MAERWADARILAYAAEFTKAGKARRAPKFLPTY
jgi:hypothetical protein